MPYHAYSYLEQRYSRKTRLQVLVLATGLTVALVVGLVALQAAVTDAARNARANREYGAESPNRIRERQDYLLRITCDEFPEDCAQEQEEIREQNCQLYGEDCQGKGHGPNRKPASFMDDLDKRIQGRMRNPQ